MRCLIIDDDPLICDLIVHYCEKTDGIRTVTTTNTGFESINLINNNDFDIIFLDYNLPDTTGKDILEVINPSTQVIMITSHKDFAPESYDYEQITDFLVKPIKYPRFAKAVKKAIAQTKGSEPRSKRLFFKDGTRLVKVDLNEVLFFKSEANYIAVNLKEKKVLTLMTIKELETKLPDTFMRIHRSYIVNLNLIEEIGQGEVKVNGVYIPVSDRYEKELMKRIDLLN